MQSLAGFRNALDPLRLERGHEVKARGKQVDALTQLVLKLPSMKTWACIRSFQY